MKRRSFLLAVGMLATWSSGCGQAAQSPSSSPRRVAAPSPPAPAEVSTILIRSFAEAPPAGAAGDAYAGYLMLVPTHEETQATPELRAALEASARALSWQTSQRIGALFVGDDGAFSPAVSGDAIADLNTRYGFGLDPSGGAVLVIVGGNPATTPLATSRVYSINDPLLIAASLQDVARQTGQNSGYRALPPNQSSGSVLGQLTLASWAAIADFFRPPNTSSPATSPTTTLSGTPSPQDHERP
jgi:hypothetical protein